MQVIIASFDRFVQSESDKKTKTISTSSSKYSSKWITDKTIFRKIFNVFSIKTKIYRNINQFHNFESKNIITENFSIDSSSKNLFSKNFFFKFLITSKALSKATNKANDETTRISFKYFEKNSKKSTKILFQNVQILHLFIRSQQTQTQFFFWNAFTFWIQI